MMRRCYNPSDHNFEHYGGRGISVHPDFHNKVNYANYAKSLPNADEFYSIDRIDNDGDYAPGNLRWATQKEQARNQRTTGTVIFRGEPMGARDFAEQHVCKFRPHTVVRLAQRGFTGEEILAWEAKCPRAGVRHRKRRA